LLTFRLDAPVKRDAYAEIVAKHNEIVKRGESPGPGDLEKRRHHHHHHRPPPPPYYDSESYSENESGDESENGNDPNIQNPTNSGNQDPTGILFGNTPIISPAVALDEDGQDVSMIYTKLI
jgi:hypothetical protein